MNLSKVWLTGMAGYVVYFVKLLTGYEIPGEMVDHLSEFILLGIGLAAMFANRVRNQDPASPAPPFMKPADEDRTH